MSLVGAQVKLREMKPGMLSHELKEALGMPEGAPPPWLINMQVIILHVFPTSGAIFILFCSWPFDHKYVFFRDMVLHHHTLI